MSQDLLDLPAPPAGEAIADASAAASDASDSSLAKLPAVPIAIESPPPAAQPARETEVDPRTRLHQLAAELTRSRSRRLLIEFLQLRRALR